MFHEYCPLITATMSKQQSAFYMLHYLEGWSWKTLLVYPQPQTKTPFPLSTLPDTKQKPGAVRAEVSGQEHFKGRLSFEATLA